MSDDPQKDAAIDALKVKSVTIELDPMLIEVLAIEAYLDDRSSEYIARKILREWACDKIKQATKLKEALEGAAAKRSTPPPTRKNEKHFERELASQLGALGLRVDTQVSTGAGTADVVIYAVDGKPLAVIEVKLALSSWREVHQALGQAQAYAKSLGASASFVTSPSVDDRLFSGKTPQLLRWSTAAAFLNNVVGDPHVVPFPEGKGDCVG